MGAGRPSRVADQPGSNVSERTRYGGRRRVGLDHDPFGRSSTIRAVPETVASPGADAEVLDDQVVARARLRARRFKAAMAEADHRRRPAGRSRTGAEHGDCDGQTPHRPVPRQTKDFAIEPARTTCRPLNVESTTRRREVLGVIEVALRVIGVSPSTAISARPPAGSSPAGRGPRGNRLRFRGITRLAGRLVGRCRRRGSDAGSDFSGGPSRAGRSSIRGLTVGTSTPCAAQQIGDHQEGEDRRQAHRARTGSTVRAALRVTHQAGAAKTAGPESWRRSAHGPAIEIRRCVRAGSTSSARSRPGHRC